MSKSARKRRALKRRDEKRKRKEHRKALYKRYAEEGRARGVGRSARKSRALGSAAKARQVIHTACGNVGCIQCNPIPENLSPGRFTRYQLALRFHGWSGGSTFSPSLGSRAVLNALIAETLAARGVR